jgi:5-methylcytosine-specific restriction endonuclease McrA
MRLKKDISEVIWKRANSACEACGVKPNPADPRHFFIHHKIHKAQGGTDTPDNLILLCPDCTEIEHPKMYNLIKKNSRIVAETPMGIIYERCY